ncbi:MAG: hypothetical protein HY981_03610 [Candidatus Magasanikbacteria bacterium]|nr:hypothetical protein [Candidatus Magasanikbacteria bacterium]
MLQHHEKKILLFIGVTFITLCIFIFALIVPTMRRISALNHTIFQLQHDLELRYERTSTIRKSKVNLGKVKQFTSEFQTLFIAPNHELDFIVFLENTARARHLEQNLSLLNKQPVKQSQLIALTTQLQVSGNYIDVLAYLFDLEQAPLVIQMSNITLTQGSPNGSNRPSAAPPSSAANNQITLSAQATTYVNP